MQFSASLKVFSKYKTEVTDKKMLKTLVVSKLDASDEFKIPDPVILAHNRFNLFAF